MEDISAAIGSILNDPEKMEQLRQVAQSLGLNPPQNNGTAQQDAPQQNSSGFDPSAIASILQTFQNNSQNHTEHDGNSNTGSSPGTNNLDAISKIAGIMSTLNQSDKNVELLRSLKPHFSSARAGKIDDAVRIMQMMRAWPALRDSGLLGGLGNLFSGGGSK